MHANSKKTRLFTLADFSFMFISWIVEILKKQKLFKMLSFYKQQSYCQLGQIVSKKKPK